MPVSDTPAQVSDLLALERQYCSFGDTVHYLDPPKVFSSCDGSYLYDEVRTLITDFAAELAAEDPQGDELLRGRTFARHLH